MSKNSKRPLFPGCDPKNLESPDALRVLAKLANSCHTDLSCFAPGDCVRVIDGPLTGYAGTIIGVIAERETLRVMIKTFGRNTPVKLEPIDVENQ